MLMLPGFLAPSFFFIMFYFLENLCSFGALLGPFFGFLSDVLLSFGVGCAKLSCCGCSPCFSFLCVCKPLEIWPKWNSGM